MRKDKYADKSAPMRIFHTYTGYITVLAVLFIVASGFLLYFDSLPFFESWSCNQLRDYLLTDNQYGEADNKKHIELTEDEHLRLHVLYDECTLTDLHDLD